MLVKNLKKLINLLRIIPYKNKVDLLVLSIIIIATSLLEVLSVYLIVLYKIIVEKPIEELFPFFVKVFNISMSSARQEQLYTLLFCNYLCSIKHPKNNCVPRTDLTSGRIGIFI